MQTSARNHLKGRVHAVHDGAVNSEVVLDLGDGQHLVAIVTKDSAGPGDKTGSLRRIRFVDGKPQPPETMATPLDFPDGIGIFE